MFNLYYLFASLFMFNWVVTSIPVTMTVSSPIDYKIGLRTSVRCVPWYIPDYIQDDYILLKFIIHTLFD